MSLDFDLAEPEPETQPQEAGATVATSGQGSELYQRFSSRGEALYADKVLSAMRKAFGGHQELPTPKK